MDKYSKIESKEDFLAWCFLVNENMGAKTQLPICDLQDVFAHSDQKIIKEHITEDFKSKLSIRMYLFAIYKAMGHDTFMDYMNFVAHLLANNEVDAVYKDVEKNWSEINDARKALDNSKKSIYKKIGNLSKSKENLRRSCDFYTNQYEYVKTKNKELQLEVESLKKQQHQFIILKSVLKNINMEISD